MGLGIFEMFDLNRDGELDAAEMTLAFETIYGDEVDDGYDFEEDDEDDDY